MSSFLARTLIIVGLVAVAAVNIAAPRLGVAPPPQGASHAPPPEPAGPHLIPVPPGRG